MRPNTTQDPSKKRTGREPANEPVANRERGIRLFERLGRPNPYGVQWRVAGQVKTEFFPSDELRAQRATVVRAEKRAGLLATMPTRAEVQDWYAFRLAIGATPWSDVVAAWKASKTPGTPAQRIETVAGLVATYLAKQKQALADGRIVQATYRRNVPKAEKFGRDFGDLPAAGVTGVEIEEWLHALGHGPDSVNTHRKILHVIFSPLLRNPMKDVRAVPKIAEEVGILSVEETTRLFGCAAKTCPELVPRLACEAFAGLRYSSAFRLEKKDVTIGQGLLLPAHKLKTKRRHYLEHLPENLWAWFKKYENPATWALTERQYMESKSKLFTDAKVPHPHNCLRHSFCTYHVSAYGDPAKTALILCHRNQNLLWSTYRGRATQQQGLEYFLIVPAPPEKPSRPKSTRRTVPAPTVESGAASPSR